MERIVRWLLSSIAFLALIGLPGCDSGESQEEPTPGIGITSDFNRQGKGRASFDRYQPLSGKPINLWYHTPREDPKDLPILFVFHGVNRNAQEYRDNWVQLSEQYQVLVIVPEFSQVSYPGSRSYQLGNMFDGEGEPVGEDEWTFSVIEAIFDFVVEEIEGTQQHYDVFGHSAGSQFAHRFLTYKTGTRVNEVIAANAGWYTLVDFGTSFPYGLKDSRANLSTVAWQLRQSVTILLGEEDTDINDPNLRDTQEANAQGPHRLARGQFYFQLAREVADQFDLEFNWKLELVPGVGHSNALMAAPAAKILYE